MTSFICVVRLFYALLEWFSIKYKKCNCQTFYVEYTVSLMKIGHVRFPSRHEAPTTFSSVWVPGISSVHTGSPCRVVFWGRGNKAKRRSHDPLISILYV